LDKFQFQADQYEFPYHFIPHFRTDGTPMRVRQLRMGMEYLCYQLHAAGVVKALRPDSVLEVGCGDGRFVEMLSHDVPKCMGADLVPAAIGFARAFAPKVEFLCGDFRSIEEQFDVVACIEVLEHVADADIPAFVDGLVARTRPGGHIVISVPTDVVPVHRKHYRHYNMASLDAHMATQGASLRRTSAHHVYSPPWWMSLYLKATCSRQFVLEIPALNRLLWRRIWRERLSTAGAARHLVAIYHKPASP
jgi:2-polyprenyl-3-methyl-5-hydroxy-6-metoxy-1,4-benzoquinol methylase